MTRLLMVYARAAEGALMDRDQLLDAINARIDRFVTGQADDLTSQAAAIEATMLAGYDDDLDVAYTLALFHHYRVVAGLAEQSRALRYFDAVYRKAPDLVPDGLRELVAGAGLPNPIDVEVWLTRAQDLLRHPGRYQLPDLFLDAALLLRLVLEHGELSRADRAGVLSGLVIALTGRFEMTGELDALNEGIDAAQRCVTATPGDDRNLSGRRSNLASALASRFDHVGSTGDLERAITELWRAVDTARDDERPSYLTNLASALRLKFLHSGDLASLTAAVDCARRAVAEVPKTHPRRPRMLATLALALRIRHQRLGSPVDLDQAVIALYEAVRTTSTADPDHAGHRSALGTALRVRFGITGRTGDIDGAVEHCTAAVESGPGDPGRQARFLSNLGAALSARFRTLSNPSDLTAAVETQTKAAALVESDDPLQATVLANLALSLQQRAALTGSDTDRDLRAAADAYAQSGAVVQAAALVRATSWYDAGLLWARCADWSAACDAFGKAVDLVSAVIDHDLDRDDRQYHLSRLSGLGSEAAAAALRAGRDCLTALEVLERARGVLLAQARTTRAHLATLREHQPELADRFIRLSSAVERGEDIGVTDEARIRHRREHERNRLLAEIRAQPGWAQFLQPVHEPISLQLASPAVVVNVARSGCDALIIHDGTVTRICLDGLSYEDARSHANELLEALYDPNWTSNDRIRGVLTWLWRSVVEPILTRLSQLGATDSISWIPTGPMTVLPLHAAEDPIRPGASTLERIRSSYSPTLRILSQGTVLSEPDNCVATTPDELLIVGVPEVAGHRTIPGAASEASDIARRATAIGHPIAAPLLGPAATRAAVLGRLARCRWAHFACHAITMLNPADSHLVLADGTLAVREIADLENSDGYLAYLSACTTAFGGTDLVDESIHISSAFQLAGFRHVIGTLWQIDDEIARITAGEIYERLATSTPSSAVHRTIQQLRTRYPGNPRIWASLVHVGPN